MKVAFTDVDQQSVAGRTARAVHRVTGETHTTTIASNGSADFGQLVFGAAYEVYGVNSTGTRVTSVLVVVETNEPEPDPNPPTSAPNFTLTALSQNSFHITRTTSVPGAVGYRYRVDGGDAVTMGSNATVSGLDAGETYSVQLQAFNAEGDGPWSDAKTVTTDAAPQPPQDAPTLAISGSTHNSVSLTWTAVAGATGYAYRVDGGTAVDVGNVLTTTVTGLDAEEQYSFEVRAYNAAGPGEWSDAAVETTGEAPGSVVITESFDKPDGPGAGPDLTWTNTTGAGEVGTVNGQLVSNRDNEGTHMMFRAEHDLSLPDQYAEVDLIEANSGSGTVNAAVVVRYDEATNSGLYLNLSYQGNGAGQNDRGIRILTITDNQTSTIATIDNNTNNWPLRMRCEVREVGGGQMTVRGLVDGVEVITYTGASLFTENRRTGIRATGGSAGGGRNVVFDNFEAGDLI